MMVDLVDYEVDPYVEAMLDHLDGGGDNFFHLEAPRIGLDILEYYEQYPPLPYSTQ
jgi:hypothetical protein